MFKKCVFLILTLAIIFAMLVTGFSIVKGIFITDVAIDKLQDYLSDIVKFHKDDVAVSTPLLSYKASISIDNPTVYLNADTINALEKKLLAGNSKDENELDNVSYLTLRNGLLVVNTPSVFSSEQRFEFSQLELETSGKKIKLKGKLSLFKSSWVVNAGLDTDGTFNVTMETGKIELTKDIYNALGEEGRRDWDNYSPEGNAAIKITISKTKDKDAVFEAVFKPLQLKGKYINFKYPVENINGTIKFLKDTIAVDLECTPVAISRQAKAFINGKVGYMAEDAVDVSIKIEGMPLDTKLQSALPGKVRSIYDRFNPQGVVNLNWHLTRAEGRDTSFMDEITVIPQKISARYENIPLEVSNITGAVYYDYKGFDLRKLTGNYNSAIINLSGFIPSDDNTNGDTRLKINAKDMLINNDLIKSLPAEVTGLFKDVNLNGLANIDCNVVLSPKDVTYKTKLHISKSELNPGILLSDVDGDITFEGVITDKKHSITGSLNINKLKTSGKKFSNLSAELSYSDGKVNINNIKTFAYGGVIKGEFSIDTNTSEYSGACDTVGIDLAEYIKDTDMAGKKFSGDIQLVLYNIKGKGADLSTFTADGSINIKDGYLWEVPIMVNILSLNITNTRPLTSGTIEFSIAKEKFQVSNLALAGDGTVIAGTGSIKFNGKLNLDMDIKTTPLSGVPVLELLGQAFDIIKNGIFNIKVKGTFKEPDLKLKVLH